jgi:hypothetical protein
MNIRLIPYKNLLKNIRCVFTKNCVPLDIDFSPGRLWNALTPCYFKLA